MSTFDITLLFVFLTALAVVVAVFWAGERLELSALYSLRSRGLVRLARYLARQIAESRDPSRRFLGHYYLTREHYSTGNTQALSRASDNLLRFLRLSDDSIFLDALNSVIIAWINLGRYEEAVRAPRFWSHRARIQSTQTEPRGLALVYLNVAEALHNLGRNRAALKLLGLVRRALESDPFMRSGRLCLCAWILLHEDRVNEARAALELAQEDVLGDYRAELEYTRALLALKEARYEDALRLAQSGRSKSVRSASARNGWFMEARALRRMERNTEASRAFELALRHHYRKQGGAELLEFAALLDETGDIKRAQKIRKLAAKRDPEHHLVRQLSSSARSG